MSHYRLFIGNPGTGKSMLANCLAKRVLLKSRISSGSSEAFKLGEKGHDGVIYLKTPGLTDIKIREGAARAITAALRQDGRFQVYFVVTLKEKRFRPEDLTAIWLVLLKAPDIKFCSIIINKLSQVEYDCLRDNNEMLNLLTPLELIGGRSKFSVLFLLHSHMLEDCHNMIANYPNLDTFVEHAPWVDVNSCNVSEIPGDIDSFELKLNLLKDNIINLSANQMLMPVRLFLYC